MGRSRQTTVSETILKFTIDDSDATKNAAEVLDRIEELKKETAELSKQIEKQRKEYDKYERSQIDVAKAAAKQAKAEDGKTKALLEQSKIAEKVFAAQQKARSQSAEQIEETIRLNDERAKSIRENIALLEAEGATTQKVATRIDQLRTETRSLTATNEALSDSLVQARRNAEDYGDAYRRASDQVESFGDVATNISAVSGAARAFGAGGVADVAMVGAEMADLVEGARRLGPALADTAQKATDAVNNFTGMGLSVGQLGLAAGAAGLAITAAVAIFSEITQRVAEEAQRQRELLAAQRDAQESARDFLVTATSEERDTRITELRRLLDAENTLRQEYTEEAIALAEQMALQEFNTVIDVSSVEEARDVVDSLFSAFNQEQRNMAANFDDLEERINTSAVSIRGMGEELVELGSDAAAAQVATNDAAKAERELLEARQDQTAAAKEFSEATLEAREAARAADEEALRERIDGQMELLDAARELAQLEDELNGIREKAVQQAGALKEATANRIQGLQDNLEKFLGDTDKKIAAEQAKTAAQRIKIEQDFMKQSAQDTQEFIEEQRKVESSFAKDRLRLLEDLQANLLSAEEDNNVIAFIRAQRAGQKQLQRMEQDATDEEKERGEAFKREQAQGKAEAAERLADLRTQSQERINKLRDAANERRQLTDQQISEERNALSQRLTDLNQALATELLQRKEAWNASLREQQAYNQQRLILEQKLAQGLAAIAARAYSNITTGATGGATGAGFKGAAAGAGSGMFAGAFTPRQINTGVTRGMGIGRANVNITGGVTIGGEVTRADLQKGLRQLGGAVSGGLRKLSKG